MLKYSALIYPEKPDSGTGQARKRIYFPELDCSHIAFVANHDSKEKMVMWALLRAIDSLILDRRNVSLGRVEESIAEADVITELNWTCKLKILVSNCAARQRPDRGLVELAENLKFYLGNIYDADLLYSILSVRKMA
jgi:hypothetical protein